jgi:hypothetical protein
LVVEAALTAEAKEDGTDDRNDREIETPADHDRDVPSSAAAGWSRRIKICCTGCTPGRCSGTCCA